MEIDDNLYEDIKDILYQNSGIYLNDSKKDITKIKIKQFILQNNLLQKDVVFLINSSTALTQKLINFFTVSETYFFREKHQIEILIRLFNETKETKILSAPCASGEEVYTILLCLKEKRKTLSKLKIIGIDINDEKIDLATQGAYTAQKLKDVPPNLVDKYFIKKDNLFL